MPLLTAPTVKNSHILAEIYFIFLKKHTRSNLKVFRYQKSNYQVSQVLTDFCNIRVIILG